MQKPRKGHQKTILNLAAVIFIHLAGAYIITRYLTTHMQTKSLAVTILGLLVLVYFFSAEKQSVEIAKKFWTFTKGQFTKKKDLVNLGLDIIRGLILAALTFGLLNLGAHSGVYHIPQESLHAVSIIYILVSVPVQQLMFFILPSLIAKNTLNPFLLSLISIPFFGTIHGYYPDIMTIVLAGVALGVPSAYLVFYRKNYYASILLHMIAGSVALTIGLV